LHETLLGVSFIDDYKKERNKCVTLDDDIILPHTLIFFLLGSSWRTLCFWTLTYRALLCWICIGSI